MRIKRIREGFLAALIASTFACSSTQQQEQGEEMALEQGDEALVQEASTQGEPTNDYQNTAEAGNEYANGVSNEAASSDPTSNDAFNETYTNNESIDEALNAMPANNEVMEDSLAANEFAEEMPTNDAMAAGSEEAAPVASGSRVVMYITADMVNVLSQPDQAASPVGTLNAGDPVLAEVAGSFAKIGEGRFVTLDSLSESVVARTRAPNPWR